MYNNITSKTYRYISIRTVPSNYILEKFHQGDQKANKQLHNYYAKYYAFYQKFIEFATGKSYKDHYMVEYMFGAMDCTKEELHEMYGVKIACAGNYEIYCIPKTLECDKIYDYIIDNVPVKYTVPKKTRGTYMDHGPTTFHRDMSKTPEDIKKKLRKNG